MPLDMLMVRFLRLQNGKITEYFGWIDNIPVCGYRKKPPGHHGREGFVHLLGLSFNINVQSRLKLHSEVVLPDNDPLKPALYQGLVEGF